MPECTERQLKQIMRAVNSSALEQGFPLSEGAASHIATQYLESGGKTKSLDRMQIDRLVWMVTHAS